MNTPFSQIYGHDLSVNDINNIFIEDQGITQEFVERHNSFIWGVRGSGKSMMLRYFDIEVQSVKHEGFKQAITKNGFIGIYLLFRNGVFNTPNLTGEKQNTPKVIHSSVLCILSQHLILASILETLFQKLQDSIDFEFTTDGNVEFCHTIFEILYSDDTKIGAISSYDELFDAVRSHLSASIRNVTDCLIKLAMGKDSDFSDIRFLDYSMFCDVVRSIQTWICTKCKESPLFYFLLDDVNFLFTYQQRILNTWIGQRQTDIICFKLASEPFGYKSFLTLTDDWELQNVADLHEKFLDFDAIYKDKKRKRQIYMTIANRRIACFKKIHGDAVLPDLIDQFLPSDQEQDERIKTLRRELSEQYVNKERERSRQVLPELHRRYGRVYCGLDDIVDISFGNIRDFLVLCDCLYSASLEKNEHSVLSPKEQNKVIKRFSREPLDSKSYLSISTDTTDNKLYNFMLNILSLIKSRLINENQMERTFDAFIIKNISLLEEDDKAVLRRGITLRFFRKSHYTSRKHLRQDVFIINKRLFPAYELNISEAGGRFEFTAAQFRKALLDEKYFIKELSNLTGEKDEEQLSLFDSQDHSEIGKEEQYEYDYGRLF